MILVLNCGSSSIKYRLFTAALDPISGGLVERIGEPDGPTSHRQALRDMTPELRLDAADLAIVGHRVVHGGGRYVGPTLLTDEVVAVLDDVTPLDPLHNPPALAGIAVARELRPDVPHVAVFDT